MSDISENKSIKDLVIEQLETIFDPEIPVNIYELGLIYEVKILEQNKVNILMTLTSPNCPVAESLPQEVRNTVMKVEGVSDAVVEITFEPTWDQDMISDVAKLELGLL